MNKYQRIINKLVINDMYRTIENYEISFYYSRKTWRKNLKAINGDLGLMRYIRIKQYKGDI